MNCKYLRNKLLARHSSALLVLAIALLTTLFTWQAALQHLAVKDHARFGLYVERTKGEIVERMNSCEEVLHGVQSLFTASQHVERGEFTAYARHAIGKRSRAGLVGLAFVAAVPHSEREAFLAATRGDGCPDFEIRPKGDRQAYYPITYLEPSQNTDISMGLDIGSLREWREAIERAEPAKVGSLVSDSQMAERMKWKHPHVFMNMPVYGNDMAQESASQHQEDASGWVVAEMHLDELLSDIGSENEGQYDVEVFDASEISAESMIHDHDGVPRA